MSTQQQRRQDQDPNMLLGMKNSSIEELSNLAMVADAIRQTIPGDLAGSIPGSRQANELIERTLWYYLVLHCDNESFYNQHFYGLDPYGWPACCYLFIKETSHQLKEDEKRYLRQCLYVALYHGNTDTAKRLLEMKPEPSVWYIFFAMAGLKSVEMVNFLSSYMTSKFMISPVNGTVPSCHGWDLNLAQWAILFGSYEWLNFILLVQGSETLLNSKFPNGMNLLHLAVIVGNEKMIDLLVASKVGYEKDNLNYPPICYNPSMRKELLKHFDVEMIDYGLFGPHQEFTLLHLAVATGNDKLIRELSAKDGLSLTKAVSTDSLAPVDLLVTEDRD